MEQRRRGHRAVRAAQDFRHAEFGTLCRDGEIAAVGEHQTAAEAITLHRGDRHLRCGAQQLHDLVGVAAGAEAALGLVIRLQVVEIETGAKAVALGVEDDHAGLLVVNHLLQLGDELLHQDAAERVLLFHAIQRQPGHPAVVGLPLQDESLFHGRFPTLIILPVSPD